MEAHASTWSTATNAFVESHSLVEIVTQSLILACLTVAETGLDVPQVPTIKISIARVRSGMLVDSAMKTLMSASYHHRLAETVRHARTPTAPTNACAPRDMRERIARSTPTTAPHSHVRMVEHAWMESVTTLACATKGLKESTAKLTSTSASHSHAKMVQLAINTSTLTLVHVDSDFLGWTAKQTMKTARLHLA